LVNIYAIRDTIADYLRSEAFREFVDGIDILHYDFLYVSLEFRLPEDDRYAAPFLAFHSGTSSAFESWSVWRPNCIGDGLRDFFGESDHDFLLISWNRRFETDGVIIIATPRIHPDARGEDITEEIFRYEMLNVFDEMGRAFPSFINGSFNTYLESLAWLDINDNFTITIHLEMADEAVENRRMVGERIDTIIFQRNNDGQWINIGGQ